MYWIFTVYLVLLVLEEHDGLTSVSQVKRVV
jgi:hypothetical protein